MRLALLLLFIPICLQAQTFSGQLVYVVTTTDSTGHMLEPYLADTLVVTVCPQGVLQEGSGRATYFGGSMRGWPVLYLADSGCAYVLNHRDRIAYRRTVPLFRTVGEEPEGWTPVVDVAPIKGYPCQQRSQHTTLDMAGGKVVLRITYSPKLLYPVTNPLKDARYEEALKGAIPLRKELLYEQRDLTLTQLLHDVQPGACTLVLPEGYSILPFDPMMEEE